MRKHATSSALGSEGRRHPTRNMQTAMLFKNSLIIRMVESSSGKEFGGSLYERCFDINTPHYGHLCVDPVSLNQK